MVKSLYYKISPPFNVTPRNDEDFRSTGEFPGWQAFLLDVKTGPTSRPPENVENVNMFLKMVMNMRGGKTEVKPASLLALW